MPVLLALLLFLSPRHAGAETLHVGITVAAELAGSVPGVDALQAGVETLFSREYGRFSELSFDTAASDAAPGSGSAARVALSRLPGGVEVSTDLAQGGVTRSLSSSVPMGAPVSLVSTIAGDLAFLFFSLQEFTAFSLDPPPALLATLQTDTLQVLTRWDASELEPIALAASAEQVTLCFPHRFLTLDPLFRITADTVRDLNAQAGGAERLQLSGIAAGPHDDVLLLSERDAVIVRINPTLGTRQELAAPGLPGVGGRRMDSDTLAVLSNTGGAAAIELYGPLPSDRRTLAVLASYASALALDPEGNLWVWDAGERRIRILTAAGREVFTIRPMIGASTMQLPQQLEVLADGSFLLGGSAEVWKFDNAGIPVWRLSRVPGRPGEQLPSSFALAVNKADGSFTLLDAPSRRLMTFGSAAARDDTLASQLAHLDGRRPTDLQEAGRLAGQAGISLMAWQFGDLLARRGGPENDRESAKKDILRDTSRLYAELADSMLHAQLFRQADGAYSRAAAAARELTAAAPEDKAAALLREDVSAKRQEARASLSRVSDVRIVSAAAGVSHKEGCSLTLTVMLRVRSNAPSSLARLRVHLGLPSITPAQGLAAVDTLFPGDERDLEFRLLLDAHPPPSALQPGGVPAVLFVTYEKSGEGFSTADSLTVPVMDVTAAEPIANSLACRAVTGDQLVAGLSDDLLDAGGPSSAPDPLTSLASLAGILDSLGGLRRISAQGQPGRDLGARPDGVGGEPGRADGVRPVLRSLSPDENDWTLLTLSVITGLGLPAGLVSRPDGVFALVDTGIPLPGALSSVPGLARYSAVLSGLSREGRLCLPFSGRLSPDASSSAAWSLVEALETCRNKPVSAEAVLWLDPEVSAARARSPVPVSFPFAPPCLPVRPSGEALRNEITLALEQMK